MLRKIASHKFSVAAIFEIALYLAIPHVLIGLGWTFTHPAYLTERGKQLASVLPPAIDGELAAIGESTLWWPVIVLLPPDLCAPTTSG